jgi:hypothetical protein
MIKKIVFDKADRLYHFPFDLEDFFPKRTIPTGEKRISTIDLGRFRWPINDTPSDSTNSDFETASTDDIFKLKEIITEWLFGEYGIKVDPRKEIYIGQGIHRIIFDFCLAFIEYGDIVLSP